MEKIFFLVFCALFSALGIYGQTGLRSQLYSNGQTVLTEKQFKAVYVESLYIGSNAKWEIDGQLDLYVKNIWIAPTAKISGSGKINIHGPENNPFYQDWQAQATSIDANGSYIDVDLVVLNANGLRLANILGEKSTFSSSLNQQKDATLKISKSIDLAVDGANVILDGHDFELGEEAKILNHNYKRFVVTNNALSGHLIKRFGRNTLTFLFPVGKQEGDYTPALLTPSISKSKVYVAVTDYLASGLRFEDESIGMDRVWNIFADKAMVMDYTLIHQVSSNGLAYVDPEAQVMQDAEDGNWIGNVTLFKEEGPRSIHSRSSVQTRSAKTLSGAWFTKLSSTPLIAKDDRALLVYGQKKAIHVLENDKSGSSPILTHSVTIVTPPKNLVVYVENGIIVCEASLDFIGNDELEYEITDRNGLTARAKVLVKIVPRNLYIPNVFTPNGDGKNDNFVISGIEAYDQVELIVVDRFGKELFRSERYQNEWMGEGLKEGTYFYNITAVKGDDLRLFKGNVLLKRE